MKKRVTGIGGIFFESCDPQKLKQWYKDHLGFQTTDWGASFLWRDTDVNKKTVSRTEWSPFKADTNYFNPSDQPYMINYRVEDLEKLLEVLKKEDVEVVGTIEHFDFGKFGWIMDPEKRKIELWEPAGEQKIGDSDPVMYERVTGLGGVFFKSEDPRRIMAWYGKHLGVEQEFRWLEAGNPSARVPAYTIWNLFKRDTTYFAPSEKPFMFNYRVHDLTALLQALKTEGVRQVGEAEQYPYGKFAWILDPEDNKIELWEPVDEGF